MDNLAHRVPAVILGLCGGGIAIVSARMNYFGAHVLVPGLSAETVAWGAVLSEFVKPFWLTGFFLLLRRWRLGEALLVLAMGLLLHAYSLVSVIGSSAEGRSTILSEREGKQNALALARQIASDAKTEADRAAGIRVEAEVQADINRLLLTPDANGCLKPQGKEAKQACSQVQALRAELVPARKADEARRTLREANAKLASLTENAPRSADPQADVIAAFAGLDQATIQRWLPLLPSMLLEFTSVVALMLAQFFWSLSAQAPPIGEAEVTPATSAPTGPLPERAAWDRVRDFLLGHAQGYVSSQRKWAELLQYPAATFNLWVKKWEEQGLIETRKNGKLTTFLLTCHTDGQDAQ